VAAERNLDDHSVFRERQYGKRTREIEIGAQGMIPLQYMLNVMRTKLLKLA
jgi:hypothetical protein